MKRPIRVPPPSRPSSAEEYDAEPRDDSGLATLPAPRATKGNGEATPADTLPPAETVQDGQVHAGGAIPDDQSKAAVRPAAPEMDAATAVVKTTGISIAKPEAKPEAKREAKSEAEPAAKPKAEPEAKLKTEPGANLKAEPEANLKAELEAKPAAQSEGSSMEDSVMVESEDAGTSGNEPTAPAPEPSPVKTEKKGFKRLFSKIFKKGKKQSSSKAMAQESVSEGEKDESDKAGSGVA